MTLTSCSMEASNAKCGTLIPYTKAEDTAFKDELKDMKANQLYPMTRSRVFDYKVTRDTIRDCLD
jgi:hypothetical protein